MSCDFDTLKVQAGYNSSEHNNAVSAPIYQTIIMTDRRLDS